MSRPLPAVLAAAPPTPAPAPPARVAPARAAHRFAIPTLLAYLVVAGVGTLYHEPWRDEAQQWLIARDLNLFGIFRQMGYEGTPALTHLLVAPLARLGLPYAAQNALVLLLAAAAVGVFLYAAPFPRLTRVLFAFSFWMTYEYAVKARVYTLGILLLFLVATAYPRRFRRPLLYAVLVALLANTTLHFLAMSLGLGLAYLVECARSRRFDRAAVNALGVMVAGGAIAALQIVPPADEMYHAQGFTWEPRNVLEAIHWMFAADPTAAGPVWPFLTAFACLALAAVLLALRERPLVFLAVGTALALNVALWTFRLMIPPRHPGIAFMILVTGLWLAAGETPTRRWTWGVRALTASLALATAFGALLLRLEVRTPFSGSVDMGRYIARCVPESAPLAAYDAARVESVLPYLPARVVWRAGEGRWGTFTTWDVTYLRSRGVSSAEAMEDIRARFVAGPRPYILAPQPLPAAATAGWRLAHASLALMRSEAVFLYAPGTAPAGRSAGCM
ncbi:MAG TPA: hypothetical protein VFQ38_20160 [Longimicrobiales bacterium]|nr:hypothetical protein [Longimicrobiales bacterium]